jgi:L-threonylcarbamoyladenylate synthase
MTMVLKKTKLAPEKEKDIIRTSEILRAGGIAALPTETVYGLAGDAANAKAVARIFAVKGRPHFNPLIAHVATFEQAHQLAVFNNAAEKLSRQFWPGPLTLVLPYKGGEAVCELARAGLQTIALRMPSDPLTHRVLKEFGSPLVAPSANRSGGVSATSALHVVDDFGDLVDIILDGGPSQHGLESTIIDVTGTPSLLRQGAIPLDEIKEALGQNISVANSHNTQKPSSPGQLSAHYATRTPLRLNATSLEHDEALLAFGTPLKAASYIYNLSEKSDLIEAAANLFSHLRALDKVGARTIAVMPVPKTGLGAAINDRLSRAALGSKHE